MLQKVKKISNKLFSDKGTFLTDFSKSNPAQWLIRYLGPQYQHYSSLQRQKQDALADQQPKAL